MKIKTSALIIIAVIVFVGGFFVYKQLNIPSLALQEVEQFTYVPIPELGVELAIQKDIPDFKYIIKNGEVSFTRASFEAKSPYCLAKDAPFGSLVKVLKKNLTNDPNGYGPTTVKGISNAMKDGLAKDFDDFYLVRITPQDASCAVAVQAKGSLISLEKTKAI